LSIAGIGVDGIGPVRKAPGVASLERLQWTVVE
jgi:hypothetical protein